MKEVKVRPALYTSKKYADGTHLLMIRITVNRKLLYEAIGHAIPKNGWNPQKKNVQQMAYQNRIDFNRMLNSPKNENTNKCRYHTA